MTSDYYYFLTYIWLLTRCLRMQLQPIHHKLLLQFIGSYNLPRLSLSSKTAGYVLSKSSQALDTWQFIVRCSPKAAAASADIRAIHLLRNDDEIYLFLPLAFDAALFCYLCIWGTSLTSTLCFLSFNDVWLSIQKLALNLDWKDNVQSLKIDWIDYID